MMTLFCFRSILFRRLCSLMGTVFLLRCCTMFATSLSVPGQHLKCASQVSHSFYFVNQCVAADEFPVLEMTGVSRLFLQTYGDTWGKIQRALAIWSGFGMTLTGVQTCGDYMFSGHTVVITMLNFFVTECEYLFFRLQDLSHILTFVMGLSDSYRAKYFEEYEGISVHWGILLKKKRNFGSITLSV